MEPLKRFIKYVKIDTQSDDTTGKTPSTEKQKNLGKILVEELLELGLNDAHMDKWGNVYAHLPGKETKIGLNAHMDTALEVTGANVNPCIVKNYQGGKIVLTNGLSFSSKEFPILKNHIGHDLIVTDGNTLLGADDKAGIAIIMSVLDYFHSHPEVEHNSISVAFTVDEEIGEGALHFDYKKMDADYAYTIDGGEIDKVEDTNFNAYAVDISVKGVSIHPGEGKGKLVNAIDVINEIISEFPKKDIPYYANEDEGFSFSQRLIAEPEKAELQMIVRDFDNQKALDRLNFFEKLVKKYEEKYPMCQFTYKNRKQYENMKPYVEKKPYVVSKAMEALAKNGISPKEGFIRGGTDGATLSKNGLITPNLGTGSFNHHGRYECLDVQDFLKMIDVVIDIVK